MNPSWYCPKCKTYNATNANRCAFCATPKPANPMNREQVEADKANSTNDQVTRDLHVAIDRLPYQAKIRIWRWMEDNIL